MARSVCGPHEIKFSVDNTVIEPGAPGSTHTINSHNTIIYNNGELPSDAIKIKIASWLQKRSADYRMTHDDVYSSRISGTGVHFFEAEEYGAWVRGDEVKSRNLECIGKPGAGKTSMASAIVEQLTEMFEYGTSQPASEQNIVLCAYFRHITQGIQTQSLVFANLLSQIVLRGQAEPSKEVLALYNEFGLQRDVVPRLDKTISVLTSEIAGYRRVYIVIDALDEFSLHDDSLAASLVKHLEELGARLLITSRFSVGFTVGTFSSMTIYANAADIATLVRGRSTGRLAKFYKTHPDLETEIIQEMSKKCDGMFIIARLLIDALSGLLTVHAIRKTLKELPPGLDATYKLTMERINSQSDALKTLARRAFAWVRFAQRPLTLPELQHALVLEPGIGFQDVCDPVHEADIFLACAGLIELSNTVRHGVEPTMQFIHFSAMEFFKKYSDQYLPNAERDITEDCLRYLIVSTPALSWGRIREEKNGHPLCTRELQAYRKTYAFSSYAATHWGEHAFNVEEKFDFTLVSAAYKHPKSPFIADYAYVGLDPPASMQPQHYQLLFCARFNLPLLLGCLQQGIVVSSAMRDAYGFDLQHIAARWGSHAVLETLTHNGEDVNCLSIDHRTPLLHAVKSGHCDIVKFLLENGANPNDHDKHRFSALWLASHRGENEIVKLLLKHKVNLNVPGQFKSQFLLPSHSDIQLMKTLLEYGVDPNIGDIDHCKGVIMTPLMDAAKHGLNDAVELLLDNGADPNVFDHQNQTALFFAAKHGQARTASLLIQRGADPDNANLLYRRTPLSYAADYCSCFPRYDGPGKADIVEMLLGLGADPNTHCSDGMTPLSARSPPRWARSCNMETQVRVTPLIVGARERHYEIVEALLAAGADPTLTHHTEKRTALSYAAEQTLQRWDWSTGRVIWDRSPSSGLPDIVRLLVENGADVDACDWENRTPLSYAAQAGNSETVKFLLSHGAMVDKPDIHGQAPISYVLSRKWRSEGRKVGYREDLKPMLDQVGDVVRIILEQGGVNLHRVDSLTRTPLSRAEALQRFLAKSEVLGSISEVVNRMKGYRLS